MDIAEKEYHHQDGQDKCAAQVENNFPLHDKLEVISFGGNVIGIRCPGNGQKMLGNILVGVDKENGSKSGHKNSPDPAEEIQKCAEP